MNVASRLTLPRRQRGNTLVGIIIGLVIGLVIAVIVALAITKGATPFTDKGKAGKAAEPTAGQAADPNKPMYGNKDAAKEAAKDFAKEPKDAAPAKEPLPPVAKEPTPPKEPTPAPVKETKPQAADPLQAVIAGFKPDGAPAADKGKPAAADDKWVYYLQVGAFRETADAESARAKLALLGFEAAITDRSTDTGVLHRVRMGPYNQVEAMNRVRTKLSESGVDVAVVRNQK
ncbi:SPOR domain-containing protein [Janthinobacterium fluminis]|uniref:SPOR domain-containing protein n=1 Tax=Janthinobacterium fluminis TaxID=2987524 RepID=A0ABT5K7J5_9BURK|nr:SPOR domain-containing protein [Janthinobacterium fluminis]MDC8760620.1 SPOR domain-containing protein [Janthinobacterium fluminis]